MDIEKEKKKERERLRAVVGYIEEKFLYKMYLEKYIIQLIDAYIIIKKNDTKINDLFHCEYCSDNGYLEKIIIDLIGYPEERMGGDLTLSSSDAIKLDEFYQGETDHYGFDRDYPVGILKNNGLTSSRQIYNALIEHLVIYYTQIFKIINSNK